MSQKRRLATTLSSKEPSMELSRELRWAKLATTAVAWGAIATAGGACAVDDRTSERVAFDEWGFCGPNCTYTPSSGCECPEPDPEPRDPCADDPLACVPDPCLDYPGDPACGGEQPSGSGGGDPPGGETEPVPPPTSDEIEQRCQSAPGFAEKQFLSDLAKSCANGAPAPATQPAGDYRSKVDPAGSTEWAMKVGVNATLDGSACPGGEQRVQAITEYVQASTVDLPWDKRLCTLSCIVTKLITYHLPGFTFEEAKADLDAVLLRDHQTPVSATTTKQGSCLAYSSLYVALARSLGFDTNIVTGATPWGANTGYHAWVRVNDPDAGVDFFVEPQNTTCTFRQ
jgi:hypothetical protein